ncbi:Alpha-ionylideneethane synthase aba3 [Fulvia fulva]|nr:Alpha-ionylideneethane synthase aba3 [Fulvia fulva]
MSRCPDLCRRDNPSHSHHTTTMTTVAPTQTIPVKVLKKSSRPKDNWYYWEDVAHDLDGISLPKSVKDEILACSLEYTRTVIPHWTNRARYVAFMRIIIMGIIAEFKGDLLDVTKGDNVLNYSLDGVLSDLFTGTPDPAGMAREYKTFLLCSGDKSSGRRSGEFFRRYVNNLAHSPRRYFRMRDSDALCRFTIAVALACGDHDDVWFTNEQFDFLAELGDTMYDAVSFFKHRSEGETNSTFAYAPSDLRVAAFKQCREVLWALNAAWNDRPEMACVTSFLRYFGGPLHMMMRRYRYVEEDMTMGREEDSEIVDQTRNNYKLWNRIDASKQRDQDADSVEKKRYENIVAHGDSLLFPGLARWLEDEGEGHCDTCLYCPSYGAETTHCFGGVELCESCRPQWRDHVLSFRERAAKVFPELRPVYKRAAEDIIAPASKRTCVEATKAATENAPASPDSGVCV